MKRLLFLSLLFLSCAAMRSTGTEWEPPIPETLGDLKTFLRWKMEYKADPLWGLWDVKQTVNQMNAQLKKNSIIIGDCEDYATYAGYMLQRMGYTRVHRVVFLRGHQICAFCIDGGWSYFSTGRYAEGPFASINAAVKHCSRINGWKTDEIYLMME